MGLCTGFSLLSGVELIYFFTLRYWIDKYRAAVQLKRKKRKRKKRRKKQMRSNWVTISTSNKKPFKVSQVDDASTENARY